MQRGTIILLFLFLFFTGALIGNAAADKYMQIKIYYDSEAKLAELQKMGLDIIWTSDDYIEIVAFPDEYSVLTTLGYKTEVIHDDLVTFYKSRLDSTKDMGGYSTLAEINARMDQIVADHPNIVSAKVSIGQTIEGRETWAFKISDNPGTDEDEPEVLFTGAIHAREPITPLTVLNFVDYLTDSYATDPVAQDLVNNREIWIIPVINPDGYYHNEVIAPDGGGMWRKNRHNNGGGTFGIDLNRNFGVGWAYNNNGSSPNPGNEEYRGTAPFSEPETQNVRDFAVAHEFTIVVFFHAYGNYIINAYSYNSSYTEDQDIFAYIGTNISAINGYAYTEVGNINGCTDDWFYGEQTLKPKAFAFTQEIGNNDDGFWPEPGRIPELVGENLPACIFYAQAADDIDSLYLARPPQQPVLTTPDTAKAADYNVHWVLNDTLNPPIQYELNEMTGLLCNTDPANSLDNWYYNGFEVSDVSFHSGPTSFHSLDLGAGNKFVGYELIKKVEAGDSLKIWMNYNLEQNFDYVFVTIWDPLVQTTYFVRGNITTTSNPYGYNYGNGITGNSNGWVQGLFSLSPYVGRYVYVFIYYFKHGLAENTYVYLDDLYPRVAFAATQNYILSGVDTSHSFSGKPEDTYYYFIRAKDAQDQWSANSFLQKTVVKYAPQYMCGDANGDDIANVSDAVYIINYVFAGGNPPDPIQSGDANCDGVSNVSDAVYIINYVFAGGHTPCDTDGDGQPDC